MHLTYAFLLHLLLPFALLRLLWRSLRSPAYRRRIGERLGLGAPSQDARPGLWIHAVSVGESQATAPLVRWWQAHHPEWRILVTTTTPTGADRVRELYGEQVEHRYFPFDLGWAMRAFMRRHQPSLIVLMETEVWPGLIRLARDRGVPTVLANARLSERSARGYARVGAFSRRVFGELGAVAAQSKADAARLRALGVPAERLTLTGSLKFEFQLPASQAEQALVIRRTWGSQRPIWVAGSTHEGEEQLLLQAHQRLLEKRPSLLLVLAPRHPERFGRVADLIKQAGMQWLRRTSNRVPSAEDQVVLADSMGELTAFIGAADLAFIGGSLVPTGGHNMLEASAQGVPVLFGPHVFNFAAVSEMLLHAGGARQVGGVDQLVQVVDAWLDDPAERSQVGENGLAVVEKNRGSLGRLTTVLQAQLAAANQGRI